MKTLLLSSLKKTINTYLTLDPDSKMRLKKLQGKVITIEMLPFHFVFQATFREQGIQIETDEYLTSETKITGTPLQMLGVMVSKENRQRFFAEDLTIQGDAEFAQQVIELFDHLQIDWEEHLSRMIGDTPAYQTGRLIRGIDNWLNRMDDTLSQNINEYLHEEKPWFPAREALNDFFTEIDTLRMDIDRMAVKIKHLETSIIEYKENQ